MNEKPVIFLDMDGVCTDFFKRIMHTFGKPYPMEKYPSRVSATGELFNLGVEEFWETLKVKDPIFWQELEPYSWFSSLYEGLNQLAPVYYLTAPTLDPGCLHGKVTWMQKQHGFSFNKYIITFHKHYVAKPNHILIDDSVEKLEDFKKHGGKTVLFQQPWNCSNPPERPDLVAIEEVKKLLVTFEIP